MSAVFWKQRTAAFSLVEVVLAIGVVSFAVLATFGLLSVANGTSKNARDEGLAARLALNEFDRIRSLGALNFPDHYDTRYFDARLVDQGTDKTTALQKGAEYQFVILSDPATSKFPTPPPSIGDWILNAEVRFPASALPAQQTVYRFTTVVSNPQ